MYAMWGRLVRWARPSSGRGARDVVALMMLAQGGARLIGGASATPVNIFPSRVYGGLLLLCAAGLLATGRPELRCHRGRWAAALAMGLWLLLIMDIWGAWVSLGGAVVLALVCVNEVRAHEC